MYYDSIRYGAAEAEVGSLYLRGFMFSFAQLGVQKQANRLLVSSQKWQALLDLASSKLAAASSQCVAEFWPVTSIKLHGLWIWSLLRFADLAAAPKLRAVYLTSADAERMTFVYR